MQRQILHCTAPLHFKHLKGVRATAGGSAAALVSQYLEQDPGLKTAANAPQSQQYFYRSADKNERTGLSQRHSAIQLRLGDARLLAAPQEGHAHISNLNNAYPLYYAETSPKQAGLCPQLVYALHQLRIHQLTELQGALVPLILKGKHVIAHAETGSGKSFGIALAVTNRLLREQVNYRLHTLILAPTEELCLQYEKWIRHLAGTSAQMVQVAVDRIPLEVQLGRLHNIQPHVLVGTPQRVAEVARAAPVFLRDTLRRRVDCLVLDEADVVLATPVRWRGAGAGAREVLTDGAGLVDRLFRNRPEEVPAQLVAASATVDSETARLLNTWVRNDAAVRLTTSFSEHSIPLEITFYFFSASARYPLPRCLYLTLELILRESGWKARILVATAQANVDETTRYICEEVAPGIQSASSDAQDGPLAARLFQPAMASPPGEKARRTPSRIVRQRGDVYVKDNTALSRWVEGRLRVGVCGFESCRGLHVNGVTHVIVYGECPGATSFLHCAGRTGRMGQEGAVVVLFPPSSGRQVQQVCDAVELPFHPGRMSKVEELCARERGEGGGEGA